MRKASYMYSAKYGGLSAHNMHTRLTGRRGVVTYLICCKLEGNWFLGEAATA